MDKKIVTWVDNALRLDLVLKSLLPNKTRNYVKKLIKLGNVRINDKIIQKPSYEVIHADTIEFTWETVELPLQAIPVSMDLDIVFEDSAIIVINKPAGLSMHPGPGHWEDTLVNGLLAHTQLSTGSDVLRPGIVHRLDRDTTGLVVIAKDDEAHAYLAAQFANKEIQRQYRGFVKGAPLPLTGEIEGYIGRNPVHRKKMALVSPDKGRWSKTKFSLVQMYKGSIMEMQFQLYTGRTHQIRVHMQSIRRQLLGDPWYGHPYPLLNRQALHAETLGFIHPRTKKQVFFQVELPNDLQQLKDSLTYIPQ